MGRIKKLDEEFEKLEVVSEGSVPQARQILEEEQKESTEKRNTVLEFLNSRRSILDYNWLVADLLIKRLKFNEWGTWTFKVAPSKEGVIMELYSPDKRIFRSAFRCVRSPYDLTAIDIFAARAQNTVDGFSSKTSGAGSGKKGT